MRYSCCPQIQNLQFLGFFFVSDRFMATASLEIELFTFLPPGRLCSLRNSGPLLAVVSVLCKVFIAAVDVGKRISSQCGHSIKSPCVSFTLRLFTFFGQGQSDRPSQRGIVYDQASKKHRDDKNV